MTLAGSSTYYQSLGEWRLLVFTFTASLFPLPAGLRFPTNKTPCAGDMARPPALVLTSFPQNVRHQPSHHLAMPLTLHQKHTTTFSHNRYSTVTTITAPSRERPVSLKIGLKSEAILIVSGFWRRIIFCREMGCSE